MPPNANLIFDVKHYDRHKTRMLSHSHLTDIPIYSVFSGVVCYMLGG